MAIEITEIRDRATLAALAPEWSALAARMPSSATPYMTPEFQLPWIAAAGPAWHCRALVARRDGRMIGLAPLFERRIGRFGITLAIRSFPIRGTTPPIDVVTDDDPAAVVSAMLRHLRADRSWDLLRLHSIAADSPTIAALRATAPSLGMSLAETAMPSTLVVPIEGSWEDFRASLGKKFRQNLRRGWTALERTGVPGLVTYPGEITDLEQALDWAQDVIRRSWKKLPEDSDAERAFLLSCARSFADRGWLRLRFLTLDGRPIAYLFDVDFQGSAYPFHSAYDLAHQAGGAGQLLLHYALEKSWQRGHRVFDFFGGSDYLSRWTEVERHFTEVRIVNAGLVSRLKAEIYARIHARRHQSARQQTVELREALKDASRPATERGSKPQGDSERA